jgi:hypothetical protein
MTRGDKSDKGRGGEKGSKYKVKTGGKGLDITEKNRPGSMALKDARRVPKRTDCSGERRP